jgi:hypothetical protein
MDNYMDLDLHLNAFFIIIKLPYWAIKFTLQNGFKYGLFYPLKMNHLTLHLTLNHTTFHVTIEFGI